MALLPLEQVRASLRDPSLHLHQIDFVRQAMLFVRLSEAEFRAASFLDERILSPSQFGRWVSFGELAAELDALDPGDRPLHFIFHAGHSGSTLLSRLLEECEGVAALREPLPLRALAEAYDNYGAPGALAAPRTLDALLGWQLKLWRRGYGATRAIVVKSTSSASRIGARLLEALPQSRALYLELAAEPYIATLLAGENNLIDLRGHGVERYGRLARLSATPPAPLYAMSPGEFAALAWAAERLTQTELERGFPEHVLAIDFDAFLKAPAEHLASALAHFKLNADDDAIARALSSAVMTRYAKAPEHAYDAAMRRDLIAQSRQRNQTEIARGLRWLEALAAHAPALAEALSA